MRLIQKWASLGALRRLACSAARYGNDEMFRARRSVLYMPGANERALEKAKTLPADSLILDLEDSVAPDAKAEALGGANWSSASTASTRPGAWTT